MRAYGHVFERGEALPEPDRRMPNTVTSNCRRQLWWMGTEVVKEKLGGASPQGGSSCS